MTAESIANALGGHRAGATWMARCPVHGGSQAEPFEQFGQGWQGARALPRRLRSTRRDRHPSPAVRRHNNVEHTAAMLLEFALAAFAKVA